MEQFESIPWLKSTFNLLSEENKVPNSLLISGPKGIGKLSLGLHLANFLLCEGINKPCAVCNACRWFRAGNHPDFIGVFPEDLQFLLPQHTSSLTIHQKESTSNIDDKKLSKFIKIDQIRESISNLNLGSYRAGKRVLLIYPVESMQIAAANSLLKSLEEPPQNSHFILITHQLDQVIPTIRSRCRLVNIPKPSLEAGVNWILKFNPTNKFSINEITQLVKESGGAPFRALEKIKNGNIIEGSGAILHTLAQGKHIDIVSCASNFSKFAINDFINILQIWIFDLQLLKQTGTVYYHKDMTSYLENLSPRFDLSSLMHFSKSVLKARNLASHPLAIKLQIESLLIQYTQIFKY